MRVRVGVDVGSEVAVGVRVELGVIVAVPVRAGVGVEEDCGITTVLLVVISCTTLSILDAVQEAKHNATAPRARVRYI